MFALWLLKLDENVESIEGCGETLTRGKEEKKLSKHLDINLN